MSMDATGQKFDTQFQGKLMGTKLPVDLAEELTDELRITFETVLYTLPPVVLGLNTKTFIRMTRLDWADMSVYDASVICNLVPAVSAKDLNFCTYTYCSILEATERLAVRVNVEIDKVRKELEQEMAAEIAHRREMIELKKQLEGN